MISTSGAATPTEPQYDLIGDTPLVRLRKVVDRRAEGLVLAKVEYLNPGGSVKDRIGVITISGFSEETGEDVVELQCHGGRAVIAAVETALAALPGLRRAQPGEFTRRAFLNGKIDLAQAESVADLIDASTETAARSASRALEGVFSREVDALAAHLIELRALTEATLDFPEEDIETLQRHDVRAKVSQGVHAIEATLERARQGARTDRSAAG